jgi:large subunit ribosomal protein L13
MVCRGCQRGRAWTLGVNGGGTAAGKAQPAVHADKIRLTGKKWVQKLYHRHSGYIGGLKTASAKELMEKRPEELIRRAVKGMLPKNKLGNRLYTKLKVYAGGDHPHQAQQPQPFQI